MRKAITVLCTAALTLTMAWGLPQTAASAKTVMKIGHSMPADTFRQKSLVVFKEIVEKETEGRVEVQLYPSGQLGTEMETLEAVKLGSVEGFRSGGFEEAAPLLEIYSMPFLFSDMEGIHKITRGPLGEEIAKSVEPAGMVILATGDSGLFRQITNNVRPITQPSDLKGLKMRTPPMSTIVKTMEALGANVVSIPFIETYMGLKTGVADGEENPLTNIVSMKFYEVQKYLTLVNYQYHAEMFYVNKAWFDGLDGKDRKILRDAAKEMMLVSDKIVAEDDAKCMTFLKDKMEINSLTSEQHQAFVEAVQPVYEYYIDKGMFTQEMIDRIREAAAK
ncbi:TRAP transporter substrate-binding protein [Dethiosulfovibrio sp. F2B]|uniref:TRAP transporter substrate-binding protein n=1 Tax=Dethiosulfovibrio faecalis TaxID=2720018 RepID=UPI001F3F8C4C|nr:TRAP transporter substrate-binding protein [Dethiosulfovibrio faecalis]MCF4152666.1 TRAP transporter substrate-binding protein [Dethiosulfovibrio faecalis]